MKLPTKDLSRCHCASRACSHLVFVFIFLAYQVLTLSTTICFVQQVLHQPPPTSFSIQSAQITLKQPILLHSITGTHSMHLVLLQREHSYISVLQDSQKACPQPPSHTFISSHALQLLLSHMQFVDGTQLRQYSFSHSTHQCKLFVHSKPKL